ncbi:MAG: hypothetical protein ACO1OC_12385 [Tuberibacillus sp.]
MPKTRNFWIRLEPLVILLAFILPYTVFRDVHAWYGSFLWWGIVGLATIFINLMITKDWGKEE